MKTVFLFVFALLFLGSCKKETTTAAIDFRDKLTGTYITSSYTWAAYPTPPTYFDSTYYHNDTVYITVEKLLSDSTSLIVMGDTLPLTSTDDTTFFYLSGCCHYEKVAYFWRDSLRYTNNTGGSPASSFGNGWKGKKQ